MKKYHNKEVIILGQKWKLKRTKGMLDAGIMGRCNPKEKIIQIDDTLKGYELEHTVLHELGHALMYCNSTYQVINHDTEEVLVDTLATFLLESFQIKLKVKRKQSEN